MDCAYIPTISYTEFSNTLHVNYGRLHIPVDCSFEITYRCNLHCAHCYCVSSPIEKELELGQLCRILDEVTDAGCLWLLLTGGEPLTRPDFLDVYKYAKRKGLLITLFTNGTLLTPRIADYLNEYRPFSIEITLYGATKDTYERVTGVSGSFERCMAGIELLVDRRLPLKLKATVTTVNRHEVWQMKEYAGKLGVEFRFDPVLSPKYDRSKGPTRLRITPRQVVDLDLADEGRMKELKEFCSKFWDLRYPEEIFACTAGTNSCHVDPQGRLQICAMVKQYSYDLLDGTFEEGWERFIPELRSRKHGNEPECKRCKANPICDQCAGWALLEHGDLESRVEYLCQIAYLRAHAFGMIEGAQEEGGGPHAQESISEASDKEGKDDSTGSGLGCLQTGGRREPTARTLQF